MAMVNNTKGFVCTRSEVHMPTLVEVEAYMQSEIDRLVKELAAERERRKRAGAAREREKLEWGTRRQKLLQQKAALVRMMWAAQNERDAFAEIVAKLPKTADGVPVAPDDYVYYPYDPQPLMGRVGHVRIGCTVRFSAPGVGYIYKPVAMCYSTERAAEKAQIIELTIAGERPKV